MPSSLLIFYRCVVLRYVYFLLRMCKDQDALWRSAFSSLSGMKRVTLCILFATAVVFGGQSLVVNGTISNGSFPSRSKALPWRVELYLHDWADAIPTSHVAIAHGVGFQADIMNLSPGRIILQAYSWWDGDGSVCQIDLSNMSPKGLYLRFQRDPAAKISYCEVWNTNGIRLHSSNHVYSFDYTYDFNGIEVGDNTPSAPRSIGFFRIHSTIVPLNSRPPVTYDPDDVLLWWKFDGDLSDSSGHGYEGVFSGGSSVKYAATPRQGAVAFPKTYGAPGWSNWVSLRAGVPQQLDGSASYSQGDSSSSVTYLWQQVSGPTNLIWDAPDSATPTIRGLIFGTYVFRLGVKDVDGMTGAADLTVGAVATDSKGVVVQANPAADLLFGPMIAFGKNPWGYADERALTATTLRSAAYDAAGVASPSWTTPQTGTVSYDLAARATTVAAAITATDRFIQLSDVTQFDLTTFPTLILVGNAPFEEIHICSASGNRLEVCYDGRGWRTGADYHLPAQAWIAGAKVFQLKMTGKGTQFLRDFCPAGPGWSGTISYQNGSVAVTAGSASVKGQGTAWSNLNAGGRAIRIEGTHGGGTPFVFHAYVSIIDSATSLAMNRPWPIDADSGTFNYTLINADTRNITPHYDRRDGTDGQIYFITSGCESDTDLYRYLWWDGLNGAQADKPYSWMDGWGYVGDFGPNFYDEGLAHYALYLRSGWQPALEAFRKLEGQEGGSNPGWLWYPELAQGDAGGIPRRMSIMGAVVAAVLDGKASNWSALRTLATRGIAAIGDDCDADTRENAYALSWLALAALFDPDLNQRANWVTHLSDAYARDNKCKNTDNSWRTGEYWNLGTPPLSVTNGSAAVTGTGIPATICQHSGTATNVSVTNGSDIVTGTGFVAGTKISIDGTLGGVPRYYAFDFILDNAGQVHLSGMWPGDTANGLTALIDSDDYNLSFGTGASDPQLAKNWSCTWNNSSSITLDRPWDGPSSSDVYGYRGNLSGLGQQPFILGIKTLQMSLASKVPSSPLNTNYGALAVQAANWIKDSGYDPVTGGLYYGRIFSHCEPVYAPSSQPAAFFFRNPQCSYSPKTGIDQNNAIARALNGEAQNAIRILYENAPTVENKTFGDKFYGSQWGAPGYTQPGFYSDGDTTSNIGNGSLAGYKWTGFFFGIGMMHQWPAVRLGGVQPSDSVSVPVNFDLGSKSPAVEARVTVTQPSSAQAVYHCSTSPCSISIDRRQGAHWVSIDYVSDSGPVVSSAAPYLLEAP